MQVYRVDIPFHWSYSGDEQKANETPRNAISFTIIMNKKTREEGDIFAEVRQKIQQWDLS